MNILELCLSSGLGGLELYVFRAANALNSNNKVLAVINKDSKLAKHFKAHSNVNTLYLSYSKSYIPLINAYKLARILDNNDIDAIHMHWGNDLALAAFAKIISTKKPALIYTRHMKITRRKDDLYHNILFDQMNLMLTITKRMENDAKKYIEKHASKIMTLYHGVSKPDHFLDSTEIATKRAKLGYGPDDFVVGLLGRLEHNKGQHLLIKAVSIAQQENHNICALIIGHEMSKGYRNTLIEMAINKGISENIVIVDFTPKPQQLMQLCDCVVLATYEETFGLVLPEAMRASVAVIGSNSGGVPEIIDHEKTGLLFKTNNANSLYQQLKRLYLDVAFKNDLAIQGRKSADELFDSSLHFQQLVLHLNAAINNAQ